MAIELIAHTEVGAGGAATITFSSIPTTYDDLWLLLNLRSDYSGFFLDTIKLTYNGDTGSNYGRTFLYARGTTLSSAHNASQPRISAPNLPGSTVTTSAFGPASIYIPDYKNSNYYKQAIIDGSVENASTTLWQIQSDAALYMQTTALTSITLDPVSGNLVQYSAATLYGITKA